MFLFACFLQIAYKLAREQFAGRLSETFLVLADDEPRQESQAEVSHSHHEGHSRDPRRDREAGRKHPRADSMSVDSQTNSKKPDQSKSAEKSRGRSQK